MIHIATTFLIIVPKESLLSCLNYGGQPAKCELKLPTVKYTEFANIQTPNGLGFRFSIPSSNNLITLCGMLHAPAPPNFFQRSKASETVLPQTNTPRYIHVFWKGQLHGISWNSNPPEKSPRVSLSHEARRSPSWQHQKACISFPTLTCWLHHLG